MEKTYTFIFPNANALPHDFETNLLYDKLDVRNNQLIANNKLIYEIKNFYSFSNYFIFNALARGGFFGKHIFIVKPTEGAIFSLLNLEPDASSFYLPIFSEKYFRSDSDFPLEAFDGKYFYTSISSLELFQGKDHKTGIEYPAELAKFFKEQSAESNPILLRLLPKSRL